MPENGVKSVITIIKSEFFEKHYIKELIISFYSSYEENDKTKDFSLIECDYKKLN